MMGDLTENFSKSEFACKCGCGVDKVDKKFLWELQLCREGAGISFKITSGYRCPKHNKEIGGSETSDHLRGEGVDIACTESWSRCKILDAAFDVGFDRIGIAKTFIHLGRSEVNPRRVVWVY